MMRRTLLLFVAAALSAATLFARSDIHDISIRVSLQKDGTASITETWNVDVAGITEWYLVRMNLGDMTISNLRVSDENGRSFLNEGQWDIDRNIREKAFKCGIVEKGDDGCEICWGVGSDGAHVFTVSYDMSNAVKSLTDYDMLHMQLVSPGLSSAPEHVKVSIDAPVQIDTTNSRIWGFGYDGTANFINGKAVFESSERFSSRSSIIALLRFDKGIFNPESIQARSFEDVWEIAKEGSSFAEDSDDDELGDIWYIFISLIILAICAVPFAVSDELKPSASKVRKFLGISPKEINWSRDLPFDGNLIESNYIAQRTGENSGKNTLASSLILRMLQNGQLTMRKDAKGKIEIYFSENADLSKFSDTEHLLFQMMKDAAGKDGILQDKEFSKWSHRHANTVAKWINQSNKAGKEALIKNGDLVRNQLSDSGRQKARGLVGFRKYLQDFTLLNERHAQEVVLWQDYLCFAALFGIADEVAKELKDIDPKAFDEITGYDYSTMNTILYTTRMLSHAITDSVAPKTESSSSGSSGGFGGLSSFGGGGGFSGGGFGGGGR